MALELSLMEDEVVENSGTRILAAIKNRCTLSAELSGSHITYVCLYTLHEHKYKQSLELLEAAREKEKKPKRSYHTPRSLGYKLATVSTASAFS